MALLLDSTDLEEARRARNLGGIDALTTNPLLLAGVEGRVDERLAALVALGFDEVYYQLRHLRGPAADEELARAIDCLGPRLVLKIPPSNEGLARCAALSDRHPCCVTAVFSPAQALRAAGCGARQVAVYVHRATQELGDGIALLSSIVQALQPCSTRVLAASLKSAEEAAEAAIAGAPDLTLRLPVLEALAEHPATTRALEGFDQQGRGLELD